MNFPIIECNIASNDLIEKERNIESYNNKQTHTPTHTHSDTHENVVTNVGVSKQVFLKISVIVLIVLHLPVQVDSDSLKYPSVHTSHLPGSVVHFPQC